MAQNRMLLRLAGSAAGLFSPFLSFVYPPACLSCNAPMERSAGPVCAACWGSIGRVGPGDPAFRKAYDYLVEEGACDDLTVPFYFESGGPMQRLMHELKYSGMAGVGSVFGARVAAAIPAEACGGASGLIVPVPLHRAKLRERGYNQADWIAAGMGRFLGLPVERRLMRRCRYTQTQTHLDVGARRANVAGAFRAARAELLGGCATVLLIDDVITTGATIGACAAALKDAGARRIVACAAALAL